VHEEAQGTWIGNRRTADFKEKTMSILRVGNRVQIHRITFWVSEPQWGIITEIDDHAYVDRFGGNVIKIRVRFDRKLFGLFPILEWYESSDIMAVAYTLDEQLSYIDTEIKKP
jgi:hypothetical protein